MSSGPRECERAIRIEGVDRPCVGTFPRFHGGDPPSPCTNACCWHDEHTSLWEGATVLWTIRHPGAVWAGEKEAAVRLGHPGTLGYTHEAGQPPAQPGAPP